MDRLKKEWKEAEVPEELRLRARNLAWAKLQRPAGGGRVLRGSVAAATTIAAIALWTGFERKPSMGPVESPVLKSAAVPARLSAPVVEETAKQTPPPPEPVMRHTEKRKQPVLAQTVAPSAPASAAPEKAEGKEHERIVLNFMLPESGARLIWIIDSNFNLNGDI